MTSTIQRLLQKLEDPKRPLLGPTIKWLKLYGLILPRTRKGKMIYLSILTVMGLFIISEYVDMIIMRNDVNHLLLNFKYSMLSSVNVIKVITMYAWHKHWMGIFKFTTRVDIERRNSPDPIYRETVRKYTKYCRIITYIYWFLGYCTVIMIVVQPAAKYLLSSTYRQNVKDGTEKFLEVVNSWTPFDKTTMSGYLISNIIQGVASLYSGGWITSYDTNAFVLMIFFRGELELLRRDCRSLFGTEENPVTKEEAQKRIDHCHQRHNDILKYFRLFDSCLSPIMLLYVIVCSVMLCATTVQLTTESSAMQKLITFQYLMFGVSQVFIYCWHSNDVFYVSQDLMLGPYESYWWTRTLSEQKNLHLLAGQLNKQIVLTAGPFSYINLATFINILKGAYSYYTLLN
ncbi:odorant receptor 4-like [Danaus plexippus]|uniref:odorant receptor 4-like n=1 Tax=Danaus plexippus TaxID=13037 RepID=UPI0013C4806D|nr:odorant receptor 4-like [Danaus plexippus]